MTRWWLLICHVASSSLLIGRSSCWSSKMAPTLVEHVVADAGAFLKKAPLQVGLCSRFDLKRIHEIIPTCQVMFVPPALSVGETAEREAACGGGPQTRGACTRTVPP